MCIPPAGTCSLRYAQWSILIVNLLVVLLITAFFCSIGTQDTSALLTCRFTSAVTWLCQGKVRRLPVHVPVRKARIARYHSPQQECKQGLTEYLCWVQASVSIQVSAALSENVYSRRAAVAELVVIASDEFGRGLGRYERQAKDHIGFTVNCKTAGCVVLGDL